MAIINGTNRNDLLNGTNGSDVIKGLAGNDTLNGNGGGDTLEGGAGDDLLNGGGGADQMVGGEGNDRYIVNSHLDQTIEETDGGIDTVVTSLNNYGLRNNVENLILLGSANLNAFGNSLDNSIIGNKGNNSIHSGLGNDTIDGGSGFDVLVYRNRFERFFTLSNTFVRGSGFNKHSNIEQIKITAGSLNNAISAYGFTNGNVVLEGEGGSDTLRGTDNDDSLFGGTENDALFGNGGRDLIDGGVGNDTIDGGAGDDLITGGKGSDQVSGGSGYDTYSHQMSTTTNGIGSGPGEYYINETSQGTILSIDTIATIERIEVYDTSQDDYFHAGQFRSDFMFVGSVGNDTVRGSEGNSTLIGGGGNDYLNGGRGNNILYGGVGNDTLYNAGESGRLFGETGNDEFETSYNSDLVHGGSGYDRLTTGGFGLSTTVTDFQISGVQGSITNSLDLRSIEHVKIDIGSGLLDYDYNASTFTGSVEFITGGGNDTVRGGSGADQLSTQNGNDILSGGQGNDSLSGGAGSDLLTGGGGSDTLDGGGQPNNTRGSSDRLTGGFGSDRFILGSTLGSFYDDGDNTSAGISDYALITDLNQSQDIIQLYGLSDLYRLGSSPIDNVNGVGIYRLNTNPNQPDELIGIIQGDTAGLSLDAQYFQYV